MGAPAKSGRIAYGALLIRERLGLEESRDGPLFDPSMMVHFRSRFTQGRHRRINERIIREATVACKEANGNTITLSIFRGDGIRLKGNKWTRPTSFR